MNIAELDLRVSDFANKWLIRKKSERQAAMNFHAFRNRIELKGGISQPGRGWEEVSLPLISYSSLIITHPHPVPPPNFLLFSTRTRVVVEVYALFQLSVNGTHHSELV